MQLTLTSSTPWNSDYYTESGQVAYRVNSPFQLLGRTATIEKVEVSPPRKPNSYVAISLKICTDNLSPCFSVQRERQETAHG